MNKNYIFATVFFLFGKICQLCINLNGKTFPTAFTKISHRLKTTVLQSYLLFTQVFVVECVSNVDDQLAEMFLLDEVPSEEQLKVSFAFRH